MAKVYLEQKVDLLIEGVNTLIKKVDALEKNQTVVAIDPAYEDGDRTPEEDPEVEVNEEAQPEAQPDPEVEEVPEVTVKEVRGLAAKITQADGVNGKATCIKVIEGVAGKGKKLADCTDAQLTEVANQYLEILNA